MSTYKIIRFYAPAHREMGDPIRKSKRRTIKRELTLEQAQEHCSNPDTAKSGKWFDGYEKEER